MSIAEIRTRLSFHAKSRAAFYSLLEAFVTDGVPLFDAVTEIHMHYAAVKDPRAFVIGRILSDSRGAGGRVRRMSESLAWCVSGAERLALDAGEQAGTIALGLRTAASVALKNAALLQAIQSRLTAPTFLTVGIIGLLLFVRSQTIPVFTQVLPRERWPIAPALLGTITDCVPVGLPVLVALVVAYGMAFRLSADRWLPNGLRGVLDRHVFPFTVHANANLAITLAGVSALVNAKVSFGTAVERLRDCSPPWLYAHLDDVLLRMRQGAKEGDALASLYSGEARWLISAYGKRSNFAEALLRLSDRINDDLLRKITRQFNVLAFVMSTVAAVILLLVLLSSGQIGMALRH